MATDPTKKPTSAKILQGFGKFEEGFVIFEAVHNNDPDINVQPGMEIMWLAHAAYRALANTALEAQAAKRAAK